MDPGLQCWSLVTLLCCLINPCGAGDQTNGSLSLKIGEKTPGKESAAAVLHSLLQKGVLDVSSARTLRSGGEDSFIDRKSWGVNKSKKSHKKPSAQSPAAAGGPVSSEGTTGQAKEVSSEGTTGQAKEVSSEGTTGQAKEISSEGMTGQAKEVSSEGTTGQAKEASSEGMTGQAKEVSSEGTTGQAKEVSSEGTTGQAKVVSSTPSPLSLHPAKTENESVTCINCGGEMYNEKPPSRSLLSEDDTDNVESATSLGWALGQSTIDLDFRKSFVKGDRPSVAESQEDSGSGDPHVKNPSGRVSQPGSEIDLHDFMDKEASTTSTTGTTTPLIPSTEKAISPDSAEIDHLLQVSRETVLQPPSSSDPHSPNMAGREVSFEAEEPQGPEKTSSQPSVQGAKGGTDKTLVTERPQEEFSSTSIPPDGAPKASEPPSDHDIDYDERLEIEDHWRVPHFPGGDSTKSVHDELAPWHKPVHDDDILPFYESYNYPTPSFYAEGYEVDIEDDNEDDDSEEADDDDDVTTRGVGDLPKATTVTPKIHTPVVNTKPTGRQDGVFYGEQSPKSNPDINRDQTHSSFGNHENGSECRSGYVRRNNSCKSLCDIYPTYCYNGGQCYMVENTGAFCRCNTQDYIWHKGLRCESIITDFQVMCVAVGTAALVVLLLFMMTVFFAKKLYLLKTENYKLRKRNRYRTPSELHNDNFSLSTIAEGSHPNEDPNAPQKVQDLPKACLKDEEPFNIQNSLSPKHESGKGDPDIVDVNCVLNNLT